MASKANKVLLATGAALAIGAGVGYMAETNNNSTATQEVDRLDYCLSQTPNLMRVSTLLLSCLQIDETAKLDIPGSAVTDRTFEPGEPIRAVTDFRNTLGKDAQTFDMDNALMLGGLMAGGSELAIFGIAYVRKHSAALPY